MANWFYFDDAGQKQGPIGNRQLGALVAKGVIKSGTPIEKDTGEKGFAGQVPGLFATVPTAPTAAPVVVKSKTTPWIPIVGILLIATAVGTGWWMLRSPEPPKEIDTSGKVPEVEEPIGRPPIRAEVRRRLRHEDPADAPRRQNTVVEEAASNVTLIPSGDDTSYFFNSTCKLYTDGGGQNCYLYIDGNDVAYDLHWTGRSKKIMDKVRSVYVLFAWNKNHTFFLITTNNELWAMGYNKEGQVGDDTGTYQEKPVRVMGDVANLHIEGNAVYAIKTDGSWWGWGKETKSASKNVYAPIRIQNDYSEKLAENHVITSEERLGSEYLLNISDIETASLLSSAGLNVRNMVSVLCTARSNGANTMFGHDREKDRYYALDKGGVLWGWGRNGGLLGDGSRADRDRAVRIADDVKRLLPKMFMVKSGDWYLYSDRFDGDILGEKHMPYTPRIAYKNCLYIFRNHGNAFTDGTWFTPDGKLARSSHDLTSNYNVKVIINNIKLPSIVRVVDGQVIAPKPDQLRPRSEAIGPGAGQIAKSVAEAISWDVEFNKSGFGNNQPSASRSSAPVRHFSEFGNAELKQKFEQAESQFRRADAFDKAEAKKRIDSVQVEIKAAKENIAKKIFYVDCLYSVRNENDDGGGIGSFAMIIDTPFTTHQDQELQEIQGSFPVQNVTNDGMVKPMIGNAINLPISGKTEGIKELVRNKDKYQARVWFTNFRFKDSYIQYAEVLKIEIFRHGSVPPANQARTGSSVPVNKSDSRPGADASKPSEGFAPDTGGFVEVEHRCNFLEMWLPRRKRRSVNFSTDLTPETMIDSLSVADAFSAVPQFEQQKWEKLNDQTTVLTFTVNNRNGKRISAKVVIKPNESYLMLNGRRLDQKGHDEFFNTMYNELRKNIEKELRGK